MPLCQVTLPTTSPMQWPDGPAWCDRPIVLTIPAASADAGGEVPERPPPRRESRAGVRARITMNRDKKIAQFRRARSTEEEK